MRISPDYRSVTLTFALFMLHHWLQQIYSCDDELYCTIAKSLNFEMKACSLGSLSCFIKSGSDSKLYEKDFTAEDESC